MSSLDRVRLLTIGEFARASRLSPKALRLYDELGLLRPARVDEYTGYRYYSRDQLEQARLASEAVIDALRPLESAESAGDLLNALSDAVTAATSSLRDRSESDPEFAGSGSTLTALLLSGSRLALVHIGDTRAYLLRDGGLFQITQDHSVVQSLIDAGRLTPEEAWSHPQRALLLKALGSADGDTATPDLSLRDAQPGDRYLLCSDGLTSVVPVPTIRETLAAPGSSPEDAVQRLITLANEAGGPDNIACAIADTTKAA
jgi:PPM family protein phosphatase